MKVALIYPPTCDPTGPYLSVPMLTAYLRERGIEVLPIDANIEAYERLLCRRVLTAMAATIGRRLAGLDQKSLLRHSDQLLYARLWEVTPDLSWVPEEIEDAVTVLRDGTGLRFFDPCQYERAIRTMQAALRIISAAYSPLQMDFTTYRTPLSLLTLQQVETDALAANNPFYHYFSEDLSKLLA
jgi:anaerobic magnesium-protoporphyrin IX monomethyl ester cyclase